MSKRNRPQSRRARLERRGLTQSPPVQSDEERENAGMIRYAMGKPAMIRSIQLASGGVPTPGELRRSKEHAAELVANSARKKRIDWWSDEPPPKPVIVLLLVSITFALAAILFAVYASFDSSPASGQSRQFHGIL